MKTKTPSAQPPAGYDPSQFPAFAVTVDVVILTMVEPLLAAAECRPMIDGTYPLEDVVEAHVTSRRARRPGTSCCR